MIGDIRHGLVCASCGIKYLTSDQLKKGGSVTARMARCIECKKIKLVSSIRHYNYLVKPGEQNDV